MCKNVTIFPVAYRDVMVRINIILPTISCPRGLHAGGVAHCDTQPNDSITQIDEGTIIINIARVRVDNGSDGMELPLFNITGNYVILSLHYLHRFNEHNLRFIDKGGEEVDQQPS